MRVLVFGDSITQGYWDEDGGWVNYLRKNYDEIQLQDLENHDEHTIFNLGISADTSEDVLNRLENETLARTRHGIKPIVIIQVGINDSSVDHGKNRIEIDEYRKNLIEIVELAKRVSSKVIFIGFSSCNEEKTTPVFWGEYFYTNERIKKYEDTLRSVAEDNGVEFIPVFEKFNSAVKSGKDLLPDGLHPNKAGHKLIYEIVRPELQRKLK